MYKSTGDAFREINAFYVQLDGNVIFLDIFFVWNQKSFILIPNDRNRFFEHKIHFLCWAEIDNNDFLLLQTGKTYIDCFFRDWRLSV